MSGKFALIIGNTEYTDPGLAQLTAPGKDAEDFARVLKDQEICAFDDVNTLLNQPSYVVSEAIDAFFYQKKPDDLLIVYFSGHGVRDEYGALYLAVKNTNRTRLRATAIRSDYIREAMDQSRSKRQVVILDCCNSGAFPQGTKAEVGGTMGMVSALQGYGRFVLTASDATQYAWEGNQIIGETQNSLFTHFLVKGLEGEADGDGDGRITIDELYDYAYEEIAKLTPKQTPTKSISKQEGEIVLRQIMRIEDIKPVSLPGELMDEIEDTRPYVREAAVQKLDKLIKGRNIGLARSAREALEKIATDDNTTRRVAQMATQLLESIRQAEKAEEERKAREEAERIAAQKAEEERLAAEKAEAERKAREEAERLLAERKAEEERKAREEAERLAILKAEEERLAREKAEAERRVREEAEKLTRARAEREATRLKAERETKAKAATEKAAREKEQKEATEREAARLEAENEATRKRAQEELLKKKKAEQKRVARQKAKAELKAKEEANQLAAQNSEEKRVARESAEHNFTQVRDKLGQLLTYGKVGWDTLVNYLQSIPKNKSKLYTSFGLAVSFVAVIAFLFYRQLSNTTLFFSGTSEGEINVYFYDGETITKITQAARGAENWSPAIGSFGRLYFTSNRTGKAEIYEFISDGHVRRLTNTPGQAASWSPAIDPFGRLYFTSNRTGKAEIYEFKSDGQVRRLTNTPGGSESWAPVIRGQNIYFTSNRNGRNGVYLLNTQAVEISSFESWTTTLAERYPSSNP
jgi:caspase domain-containing protein/WD40 repeat protein